MFPPIELKIRGLTCTRGGRQIVAGLDMDLKSGTFLAVTGVNGAGKSTFLMCLAQHLPFEGLLDFNIENHDPEDQPVTRFMAFIAHQNASKPELSVRENLQFWADMSDGDKSLIDAAILQSKLDGLADVAVGKLSKGQQRRASIARLLVTAKPIWILDEPTSALDKHGDAWVADLISTQLRNNGMVIAATHRPIQLADDIARQNLELEPV